MKNKILISILLLASSNAYAVATAAGDSVMTIVPGNASCEILKESMLSDSDVLIRQAAKLDADYNCNEIYPGSNAFRIQRINSKNASCNEANELVLSFSAVYLCQ